MAARALPLCDPELATTEGASPAMVHAVTLLAARWPTPGRFAAFLAAVYGRYARHRGAVLAGGLAFFGMLSVVPSLLTLGALVARLISPAAFLADLQGALADNPEAAGVLEPIIDQVAALTGTAGTSLGVAGLVGLAFSLYAASRFVYVGRQVLDVAFELVPRPPSLLTRGVSILVTLVFQLALLVGLTVLSVLPRLLERFGLSPASLQSSGPVRTAGAVLLVYLLLTLAMRYGTRLRRVPWLNLGGAVGAAIVLLGTWGLGWYLTVSVTYSQIVAVLGGVIALELWLYVIGLAIVLSAEFEALRLGHGGRWQGSPAEGSPTRSADAPPGSPALATPTSDRGAARLTDSPPGPPALDTPTSDRGAARSTDSPPGRQALDPPTSDRGASRSTDARRGLDRGDASTESGPDLVGDAS